MEKNREAKEKPVEIFDDFETKSSYWNYRTDNYAQIIVENSILKLNMRSTEALYYSNAKISYNGFDL